MLITTPELRKIMVELAGIAPGKFKAHDTFYSSQGAGMIMQIMHNPYLLRSLDLPYLLKLWVTKKPDENFAALWEYSNGLQKAIIKHCRCEYRDPAWVQEDDRLYTIELMIGCE